MADKLIYINDLYIGYGTSVKITAETNSESVATFDGPVTDGSDNVSHDVEIERLRYGTKSDYLAISKLLHKALSEPVTVTVKEDVKFSDGKMRVTDTVYNCVLDNDEYELDPEERTVESISFTGGKRSRWIGGKKIY